MKTKNLSALLIFGSFVYLLLLGFRSVMRPKGMDVVESLDATEWQVLAVTASVPLVLGLLFFLRQRRKRSEGDLVLPAVLASLVPASCVLLLSALSWFGPVLDCHVTLSGTKKVYIGMTKAELEKTLGAPRSWGGDGPQHKERIRYDLQIPWAYSKEFYIDLVDGKVIRSKVVPFGREEDSDFFMNLPPGLNLPLGWETNLANGK